MTLHLRWFVMKTLKSYIQKNQLNESLAFYKSNLENKKGKILEISYDQLILLPELVAEGLRIEGLVASEEGKDEFQQTSSNQPVKIYQSKLPDFKLTSRYDAILLPFGLVSIATERMDSIKLLKNVYEHLKDQGMIIVDLFLQNEFISQQKSDLILDHNGQLYVGESKLIKVDLEEQTMTYLLSVEHWNQGENLSKEQKVQDFVWFGIKEFKLVLERIGFSNIKINRNYSAEKKDVTDKSTFTFVAQK